MQRCTGVLTGPIFIEIYFLLHLCKYNLSFFLINILLVANFTANLHTKNKRKKKNCVSMEQIGHNSLKQSMRWVQIEKISLFFFITPSLFNILITKVLIFIYQYKIVRHDLYYYFYMESVFNLDFIILCAYIEKWYISYLIVLFLTF